MKDLAELELGVYREVLQSHKAGDEYHNCLSFSEEAREKLDALQENIYGVGQTATAAQVQLAAKDNTISALGQEANKGGDKRVLVRRAQPPALHQQEQMGDPALIFYASSCRDMDGLQWMT
ncbi:unnamed protein product [Vitrella brassicaformis CCMP3155]|uniref:Uncharacterized protein n=1 Tax=Vitrella brassicaformis (strain CCMP3155) TaxID=1169540 RepID=A0A0G4FQL5_VITBC|nr:unnamed protein product [Vitrella brassicaformis CCMP3155]|eukprot:CEM16738.1 unnamed protein product [Vitrella brassicaformis CCMP3155]